jgi:hypothetical protein
MHQHTADNSVLVLQTVLDERIISKELSVAITLPGSEYMRLLFVENLK